MTNSYALSPTTRPELIIIHGMNNAPSAFAPLRQRFEKDGWKTHFVCLPCHGDDRHEANNFKEALQVFDRALLPLTKGPYIVLAFSHGALYFQLWLEKHPDLGPLAQVLLAPALYIRRQKLTEKVFGLLPHFMRVKSLSPRAFQRYETLTVREYRILLDGMKNWQQHGQEFKVPTLILVDPKDELVNASLLHKRVKQKAGDRVVFKFWPRPYLTKGIGRHHIMFHPDYFSPHDWEKFHLEIKEFLGRK